MSTKRRLRGVTGEFLIVVLGVLVALGVDQWWEGFEDDELSEFYLAALEDDLRRDSASLAWGINRLADIEQAAGAFSSALGPGGTYNGEDFSDDVTRLFIRAPISVNSAAFDDMRSSGNLRLLPTSELRRSIQLYYSFDLVDDRVDVLDESIPGSLLKSSAARLMLRTLVEGESSGAAVDQSSVIAELRSDSALIREWLLRRQIAASLARGNVEYTLTERTIPTLEAVLAARN